MFYWRDAQNISITKAQKPSKIRIFLINYEFFLKYDFFLSNFICKGIEFPS